MSHGRDVKDLLSPVTQTSATSWLPPSPAERWVLGLGTFVTTLAVAMTRILDDIRLVRFCDNVHWTSAYGTALAVVLLSLRRASDGARIPRTWFALSLGSLFIGQILWDIQVLLAWNPFPGPSDAFFVSVGPLAIVATFKLTTGQASARRAAIFLDGAGFLLCLLALTLAMYLPRRGNMDTFTLWVLSAYPTALLTAASLFVVVALELRRRITASMALLFLGLLGHGLLWMAWNLATLEGRLGDGIFLNYLFSYVTLLLGVGVATCEFSSDDVTGRTERAYAFLSRSLPLGLVTAAAIAVAFGTDLAAPVRLAVNLSMGGVILVAVLRQSLLLGDRERLLIAEEENRILAERLAQSQRLESLGTLASGIAHDFNNVLTSILGHSELLVSEQLSPSAQESADGVRSASLRARDVIRRILAFSRQDTAVTEPVEVSALVREVAALLRAALPPHHNIALKADARFTVMASAAEIHQVLMNLGTNASHAFGERGGQITFKVTSNPSRPEPSVEIAVQDDGLGMDKQTIDRIFEPFFTTKGRGEGTGLGLSVAHGLVTKHGGVIEVESAPGKGTTMRVVLPLAPAHEQVPTPSPPLLTPLHHTPEREILVIDDEPAISRLLERILRRLGQTAIRASSPEIAIDLVSMDPARFWLIITDMSMPTMTGLEVARTLRTHGYRGALVLSSGTDFTLSGTPFDDVLPKPYEAATIRELLLRHSQEKTPSSQEE